MIDLAYDEYKNLSRQEIIDRIKDPVVKRVEQDLYDLEIKYNYDEGDPTYVFTNRIKGRIAAYQKAYPDMDITLALSMLGNRK